MSPSVLYAIVFVPYPTATHLEPFQAAITDKDVRCRPYDKLMRKKKLEKINERRR
jgi:hypothetical protein